MDNTKEASMVIKCAVAGFTGCYSCKYRYKRICLLTSNYKKDDLDYLKALVDLDEEFPSVNALDSLK